MWYSFYDGSVFVCCDVTFRGHHSKFISGRNQSDVTKKCDTICRYIACSQILFCPFYLLLQPLLELGSKSTSLSSGFSDVIKAARYDLLIHCLISWSGFIPGNVGRMDAIVRCGRCLAGGRGCLLKGPHLIPSLKFRLPYLINVHQSINPFLLKSRGMKYCPLGKTPTY